VEHRQESQVLDLLPVRRQGHAELLELPVRKGRPRARRLLQLLAILLWMFYFA
jgi:hypothetical protein